MRVIFLFLILLHYSIQANATFYQAETLSGYCQEYIKYIAIDNSANQLEAGICSGYMAAAIELMNLSGSLCDRSRLNLDDVVNLYIQEIESNPSAKKNGATFTIVELLQNNYACK